MVQLFLLYSKKFSCIPDEFQNSQSHPQTGITQHGEKYERSTGISVVFIGVHINGQVYHTAEEEKREIFKL